MFTDTTDIEVINSKLGWKINNINRLTKLTRCGDYKSNIFLNFRLCLLQSKNTLYHLETTNIP
uniref:Uncharacterized protein n=1 Tax=Meloidogyne incognita TaxID=6306 RepID=A0A914N3W5_MELIC